MPTAGAQLLIVFLHLVTNSPISQKPSVHRVSCSAQCTFIISLNLASNRRDCKVPPCTGMETEAQRGDTDQEHATLFPNSFPLQLPPSHPRLLPASPATLTFRVCRAQLRAFAATVIPACAISHETSELVSAGPPHLQLSAQRLQFLLVILYVIRANSLQPQRKHLSQ